MLISFDAVDAIDPTLRPAILPLNPCSTPPLMSASSSTPDAPRNPSVTSAPTEPSILNTDPLAVSTSNVVVDDDRLLPSSSVPPLAFTVPSPDSGVLAVTRPLPTSVAAVSIIVPDVSVN